MGVILTLCIVNVLFRELDRDWSGGCIRESWRRQTGIRIRLKTHKHQYNEACFIL